MAKVGRPTLYKPEYCDVVVDLGKQGYSLIQMCAHFDITRQTIDNWSENNPEFLEALSRAKVHCQHWWESMAQTGMLLGSGGFNAAVWKKSMEARFRDDYTERKEVHNTGELEHKHSLSDMTDEQLATIAAGRSAGTTGETKS